MKKMMIGMVLFLWGVCSWGQDSTKLIVNDIDINSMELDYIEVVGTDVGVFKTKIVVVVDYGQEMKWESVQSIKDADGTSTTFQSMIGAINYISRHGWRLFNTYATTSTVAAKTSKTYHYLFERKR